MYRHATKALIFTFKQNVRLDDESSADATQASARFYDLRAGIRVKCECTRNMAAGNANFPYSMATYNDSLARKDYSSLTTFRDFVPVPSREPEGRWFCSHCEYMTSS